MDCIDLLRRQHHEMEDALSHVLEATDPAAKKARFSTIASTITSTGAVMGLESMLALQSINEAIDRDRAARERGTAMIAALTDLQRAMLTEEDPALALRSLSALAVDGRSPMTLSSPPCCGRWCCAPAWRSPAGAGARTDGARILSRIYDDPRFPLGAAVRRRYKPARPGRVVRGRETAAHLFAAETE